MTNLDAIARIRQKIDYLTKKIEGDPTAKSAYYARVDIDAYEMAISALEYADAMREYEASQSSL
jgi:hypothetical protein